MTDLLDACREAHERLIATAAKLDDAIARQPSRLPGWTVGHVLTHIARNADGNYRRVEAALRGESAARYPGGKAQREREIEEGAGRPASALLDDVTSSARRLDELWTRAEQAGWPDDDGPGGDTWPVSDSAVRRLREVEVHHVDLGLGYEPADWLDFYVEWELSPESRTLAALPGRFAGPADARRFLAWLIDRGEQPELRLNQWD